MFDRDAVRAEIAEILLKDRVGEFLWRQANDETVSAALADADLLLPLVERVAQDTAEEADEQRAPRLLFLRRGAG